MRIDATKIDAFTDMWSSLNGNSAIGMDLSDGIRTVTALFQFAWLNCLHVDLIANGVIIVSSSCILSLKVVINKKLAALSNCF